MWATPASAPAPPTLSLLTQDHIGSGDGGHEFALVRASSAHLSCCAHFCRRHPPSEFDLLLPASAQLDGAAVAALRALLEPVNAQLRNDCRRMLVPPGSWSRLVARVLLRLVFYSSLGLLRFLGFAWEPLWVAIAFVVPAVLLPTIVALSFCYRRQREAALVESLNAQLQRGGGALAACGLSATIVAARRGPVTSVEVLAVRAGLFASDAGFRTWSLRVESRSKSAAEASLQPPEGLAIVPAW